MPELPEVETIRRGLEDTVLGLKIVDVEVPVPKVLRAPPEEFIEQVKGTFIKGTGRRAKILIVYLSSDKALLFHFMMAGTLTYAPADAPGRDLAQVILTLSNGYELRYRDFRKFGYVMSVPQAGIMESPQFAHLGPEPLSDEFTLARFHEMLERRPQHKIKPLLMNQTFIAGIGNIYADETLFCARVHPERPAGTLTDEEIERMYGCIRSLLSKAIEQRGSSIANYTDAFGERGNFTNFFKVYNRTGEPCEERCGGTVVKIKVAGRGTHFCPRCQK
ncbi:MAG TPA: bifunctional DNA-formamidopyrimidine glycosylase/DNA-(apurinic or apyrimidinic site) lyase [Candidatus Aquicultor sp.]|jgi:formamidopyrimidine-DNA glycosylase